MNFDRVSDVYDATRGHPDWVSERIVDRILAATAAGPDTRYLEIGVGTGRIAVPLVKRGHTLTGVDISEQMMDRVRAKLPDESRLRLIHGDVTKLPLPDGSVDVALAVHVLHLVPQWEAALAEIRRVLVPGGYFVLGGDWMDPEAPAVAIRDRWRTLVEEDAVDLIQRYGTWNRVDAAVTESGGRSAMYRAAEWTTSEPARLLLDALHNRVFSQTWNVPQEVLDRVHPRLAAWIEEQYGSLDKPLESPQEFNLLVSRWPAAVEPGSAA